MNKGVIIAISIGLVAALAVAGVFVATQNRETDPSDETSMLTNEDYTAPNENVQSGSLQQILAQQNNQLCTFTDTESNSNGTLYVGNDKMRGDFEVESEVGVTNSHIIVRDESVYVWMEGAPDGFLTTLSDIESLQESLPNTDDPTTSTSVDLTKTVDYECSPWTPDQSRFELPDDVTFEDFSAMMDAVMADIQEEFNVDCSTCDSLPAEAQNQCRSALGC